MTYFAHISEDGRRRQTVLEHLMGTAGMAKEFAKPFHAEEQAEQIALAHDIGKYTAGFQKRLLQNGPRVDHSTAGAKELVGLNNFAGAYCVAGHHGGLPDGGNRADTADSPSLIGRIKREPGNQLGDYSAYKQEIGLRAAAPPPLQHLLDDGFAAAFFIRMLFSCLVDADFLDTERFMSDGSVQRGGGADSLPTLLTRLQEKIRPWQNPKTDLNRKRCEILQACLDAAAQLPGLFTLTVPTGGGKTISSFAFALRHAVAHRMRRIIYVIPYTSIIEQNAAVFREMVGDDNVMEHHSNACYDLPEDASVSAEKQAELERKKLAAENWDAPVIVTTNVQFFESLFSNKTSQCRKLHNIADSVIIFDEAQMLPFPYLRPCVRAIEELTRNYGCTAVLCTATQPSLQKLFSPKTQLREICPNTTELYRFFRRTTLKKIGKLTDEQLVQRLRQHEQVLCIVNNRAQARKVFGMLSGEGCFHLSTLMTPQHRRETLDTIRARLKDKLPCRLVATSLVEAGVDLDFPAVYRALAGLDSEIQAAGRCNREGRRAAGESIVYLFEPDDEWRSHYPSSLEQPISAEQETANNCADLSSPEAIAFYFDTLHRTLAGGLDQKKILQRLQSCGGFIPFADIAKKFHLIENETVSVLIPDQDAARTLAERMRQGERSRTLFRQAGQYSVNIYRNQLVELKDAGAVSQLDESVILLEDLSLYDPKTGLNTKPEQGQGIFL